MVIVELMGGLGNQMFQYAAARQLAHRLGTTLKLDISAYTIGNERTYALSSFHIHERFTSLGGAHTAWGTRLGSLNRSVQRLVRIFRLFGGWTTIQEDHVEPCNPQLASVSGNVLLRGYWQSAKYFAAIQDVIRHEFTLRSEPDPINQIMAEMIKDVEAVSVHVRRGDYIQNQRTNQVHGTCSLSYYQSCINYMADQVPQLHLFVFSDEMDWCKANLKTAHPTTFVAHNNTATPHEDLRLMSLCQHNIVANSSFSWWGAWLNANPGKIICAPQKWFNDPTLKTTDLIPDHWIRL